MRFKARRHRFTRADWIGYAVLMLIGGATGLAGLFLPWANEYIRDFVNYSPSKPPYVAGVLQTQWGWPVLAAALATVAAAVLMLVLGPRRISAALSLVVVAAGAVYALEAVAAADSMAGLYRPGLGLYITLLTGVLLVPVGLASLAVGAAMRASRRRAASGAAPDPLAGAPPVAQTDAPPGVSPGPPAPESAPLS